MSAKEQKHSENKVSPKQRSPKPVTDDSELEAKRQLHSDAVIKGPEFNPISLTANNVLRLQRAIGNQSVQRVLARRATGSFASTLRSPLSIQRTIEIQEEGKEFEKHYMRQLINEKLHINSGSLPYFEDVLMELNAENAVFETWVALGKELKNRSEGIRHHGAMQERVRTLDHTGPALLPVSNRVDGLTRRQNPFYDWLCPRPYTTLAPVHAPCDRNIRPAKMNCWEAVLYTAYLANIISPDYIRKAMTKVLLQAPGRGELEQIVQTVKFVRAVITAKEGCALPEDANKIAKPKFTFPMRIIPRGRIIVFGIGEHVALSTGTEIPIRNESWKERTGQTLGHGILELDAGGANVTVGVRENTIEDAIADKPAYVKPEGVCWGPLPTPEQLL